MASTPIGELVTALPASLLRLPPLPLRRPVLARRLRLAYVEPHDDEVPGGAAPPDVLQARTQLLEVTALRTAGVFRLAESIYAERAFDRLPVLADLLEEAGATDAAVLAHLRGPGPHALGCHALDAVLGKE
jgi:hypothetical protein